VSVDVVTLVIPARTEYLILARLALAGNAREVEIDQATLADLKLAVTEACGNAVQHAQPGEGGMVTVRFTIDDDAIEISVEDDGPGMDTASVPALPDGDVSESGMGLAIIHALVDRVEIGPGDGGHGTLVRMRRLRSTPASA
jgi:serine/threonine-protein kinase RsbW